jgi:hypothetical protein
MHGRDNRVPKSEFHEDMGRIKVIHPGRRRQTDPGLGEVSLDMSMARGGFGQGNVANPAEVLKRDTALCRDRVIAPHQQRHAALAFQTAHVLAHR